MVTSTGNLKPKDGICYRVLAYMRVSKEEKKTKSHTFETQRQRIDERLLQKFGLGNFEVEYLIDDGLSGGYGPTKTGLEKRVRKTLRTMQQKLHSGAYDLLIVYHTDRFARSPRWF